MKPRAGAPDGAEVRTMFAGVAPRYDVANTVLSGGMDRLWRRRLVAAVKAGLARRMAGAEPAVVIDLATGSGAVAFALRAALPDTVQVRGLDFCEPMLEEARKRQEQLGLPAMSFAVGDCLELPLESECADAVTISFGLRNLADRARGLAEMRRILRPGGILCVLEFTQPDRFFAPLYYAYLRHVLPRLAGLLTGRREAYEYLAESIQAFPDRPRLAHELVAAGFSEVAWSGLTFGTVALHTARLGTVRKHSAN